MRKKKESKRKEGQRRHDCKIKGCTQKGRVFARLGKIELTYCPKHRKRGERIINFLCDSLLRFKLTNFLRDTKKDLFMQNCPELCDVCYNKIEVYINKKIVELEQLEKELGPVLEKEIKEEDLEENPDNAE